MRSRLVALGAVLALVGLAALAAATGAVAAQDGADDGAGNGTDELAPDLTLDELQADGRTLDNSPDSVRSDGDRMWWLLHWPATAFGSDVGEPDGGGQHVARDTTVERNSVYLRSIIQDADAEGTRTVVVAYWEPTEREVETANGTVTREVADVEAIDRHDVDMRQGWAMSEIPLRQSNDERRVTMWVEGDETDLRWTFTHKSVATTQSAGIDDYGDLLSWLLTDFVGFLVVGAVVGGVGTRAAIKRAKAPPGWWVGTYLLIIGVIATAMVIWQFSTLAELLVASPTLIAILCVAIFTVIALESQMLATRRVAFFKPQTSDSEMPDGDDGVDVLGGSLIRERVVRMPDGRDALYRPGMPAFLARLFGKAAELTHSASGEHAVELGSGSIADELVVVDPDADDALLYESEGWTVSIPEIEDWTDALRLGAMALPILLVVSAIASAYATSWGLALGGLALAALLLEPTDGRAEVTPASAHQREAWITAMTMADKLEAANTIDELRKEFLAEKAERRREVDEKLAEADATLASVVFGDDDPDRSLDPLTERTDDESADESDDPDRPALTEGEADD